MELVTRILKIIRNVIIIVFLFAVITAVLDYTRIISGLEPIFNISSYNSVTHIEKYRGLFYQASRKTKINNEEDLEDSFDINFYVLTIKIDVPNKSNVDNFEFYLKTSEVNECSESSKLYYADKDIKIYTYCIDSINVVESGQSKENTLLSYLKKDNKIIDDLIQNISFTGLYVDDSTEMFKTFDDSFSNNGISLYKCNNPNINDIYIGPKEINMQSDFCTYKDDDFKFISTISEEKLDSETVDANEKEVFYEDDNYRYEFDEKKSDRIFIVAPAVRLSPEKKYSLKDVLNYKLLTIDELEEKGLKFNKVAK